MKIKSIEIKNIKGISNAKFDLDIIPNKPNLIVAPNGFGKSSFATAFNSLNANRINLDDKSYFENNQENEPQLAVVTEDDEGIKETLTADSNSNSINNEFDIFVINNQLVAKATKLRIAGNVIAKSSLEVNPIILNGNIPPKVFFDYSRAKAKTIFGGNGKILPDISEILSNPLVLEEIVTKIDLSKFKGVRLRSRINTVITDVNNQSGTTPQIINWIESNRLDYLKDIDLLNCLSSILCSYDIIDINNDVYCFLAAIQLVDIYLSDQKLFKKAYEYQQYLAEKNDYEELFKTFNSSWVDIKPKEVKKKRLILELPKAHNISNGQRDILCFIALIQKSKKVLRKEKYILIIDEVFDYLDDANLVSVQYYISQMLEQFKAEDRKFYPLIMTHLNPFYFNHFCFNKHKIKTHYLDQRTSSVNSQFVKFIRNRGNDAIRESVDLYHFHYHPDQINIRNEFKAIGLKETWGESPKFHKFINDETLKYVKNKTDFDPLAVCLGVRIQIEKLVYENLTEVSNKEKFIGKHGTKKKIDFAESIGIDAPETFYLLGIIYNVGMHWHENRDNISPIAVKLENLTIKKLITDLFS